MRKIYTLDVCLEDFKSARQGIECVFDMIAKVKAAVFAQAGKIIDYSFSNVFNRETNPFGDTLTLSFDIATHDDWERELVVDHFMINGINSPPEIYPMVSFRRSASTKGFLSNLDPGDGESRSVHG
jgi:hypothetical protein